MKSSALKTQRHFCVHHKTVSALLQEARRENARFVRVQLLEREILGHRVWGVLLTACLGEEIHIAWVKVQEARLYTPALHTKAVEAQKAVFQQIRHLAAQTGLEVRDGWYAVVPEILLYREPAELWVAEEGCE